MGTVMKTLKAEKASQRTRFSRQKERPLMNEKVEQKKPFEKKNKKRYDNVVDMLRECTKY